MLGLNPTDEMDIIFQSLNGRVPMQFSYAGSEICPLMNEEGVWMNYNHAYSIVACVF
jgi:hypothetical protein